MITIKMPADYLAAWLKALRSGEYKQGCSYLFDGNGYCCLGVLQMAVDGKIEDATCAHGPDGRIPLPSLDWLNDHGILFLPRKVYMPQGDYPDGDDLLENPDLIVNGFIDSAASLNDDGRPFAEIADIIEAHTYGY